MHTRETKSPLYSRAQGRAFAAALGTRPGAALLVTPTVRLWKDPDFDPTPDTDEAAFILAECDFDDYVAQSYTPAVPANEGEGIVGASGTVTFTMVTTPMVQDNTVYGYWISDAGGVHLFEKFTPDDRVAMAAYGDQLVLTVFCPVTLDQPVA